MHVKVLGGGHSRPSSGVTPEECSLLHFDLRTWPWRVGCRSIAPEPQLVRSRLTAVAAATRPKAAQDAAVCVLVCVCV